MSTRGARVGNGRSVIMFAVDDADYTSRNVDLAAAAVNGVLASDAPY